jgi:RNA polymerase sigma-70 factor (ECF subfamily)
MSATADFKTALVDEIPQLRFFALSLTRAPDRADDLVQETLIKGWAAAERFQPGTSLRAWLFTIMRNTYYSDYRKQHREIQDSRGEALGEPMSNPEQVGHLDLEDVKIALATLPADQREAILLVGASGVSYEEAAQVCGCAIGTIKSRVNRARHKLMARLSVESIEEFGGEYLAAISSCAMAPPTP